MENGNKVILPPQDESRDRPLQQRQVRVCQNTTCSKSGAAEVLRTFKALDLRDTEVVATGCLGHCGNGPMVVVLPEAIWYNQVHPQNARAIATQHLSGGKPVLPLLYDKLHPQLPEVASPENGGSNHSQRWAYAGLLLALLVAISSIIWTAIQFG